MRQITTKAVQFRFLTLHQKKTVYQHCLFFIQKPDRGFMSKYQKSIDNRLIDRLFVLFTFITRLGRGVVVVHVWRLVEH